MSLPTVTAAGCLEVVLLPHGVATVVLRVEVWAKDERGRWTFKGGRARDTIQLKAAQKPSCRPPVARRTDSHAIDGEDCGADVEALTTEAVPSMQTRC
jgi:hypothetical protein